LKPDLWLRKEILVLSMARGPRLILEKQVQEKGFVSTIILSDLLKIGLAQDVTCQK
jgi:hypothetical protein